MHSKHLLNNFLVSFICCVTCSLIYSCIRRQGVATKLLEYYIEHVSGLTKEGTNEKVRNLFLPTNDCVVRYFIYLCMYMYILLLKVVRVIRLLSKSHNVCRYICMKRGSDLISLYIICVSKSCLMCPLFYILFLKLILI